jgi:hypothetical protein
MKKTFICTQTCTFGSPPLFYDVGDALLFDGPCPMHFSPGVAPKEPEQLDNSPEEPGEQKPAEQTLAEVFEETKTAETLQEEQTADEPCNVEALAEALGANISVIKELSGKRAKTDLLTGPEVSRVKAAIKKAQE